jgi:hypothetical protein
MNADLREMLTDIKAAARLGHIESLWAALDGFVALPEVNGNAAMPDGFVENVIVPIGTAVTHARIPPDQLLPLCDETLAGLRALGAVALAGHWLAEHNVDQNILAALGRDARAEVRLALALALRKGAPEKLDILFNAWSGDDSHRLRAVAVQLSPVLGQHTALETLAGMHRESDPDLRAALAGALIELAQDEPYGVLELLEAWAAKPNAPYWVIAESVSSGWAAAHPERTLNLLELLTGDPKAVRRALKALSRHGAADSVSARLAGWLTHEDNQLKGIAERFTS